MAIACASVEPRWGRSPLHFALPVLGQVVALCRMDVTYSEPGTTVEVGQMDGHQKRIPATVVRFPHFDPDKQRVRGNYAS